MPVGIALFYIATGVLLWDGILAQALLGVSLIPVFAWITIRDLESTEIPDAASLCIVAMALLNGYVTHAEALVWNVAAGALTCALFWGLGAAYFRWRSVDGLGIGDAKLFGACVVLLGPTRLPDLVLIASLGGLVAALMFGRQSRDKGIPFGPFIAYAAFICVFLPPILV